MNFFQWLAGADKDILDKCSKDARVKMTGYGTLVLIPAIIGLFSMSYAISTITDSGFVYIGCGIIWFLIVAAVDRFVVATLHKSTLHKKGNYSLALASRILFAIVVGVAVSHPIVMFWFNNGINEKITTEKMNEINKVDSLYSVQINNARVSLEDLISRRDCYVTLKTAEQSGHKVSLPCGFSSGILGSSKRTENLQNVIADLNAEIESEDEVYENARDDLVKQRDAEKSILINSKSYDYLSRVRKLSELEKDPISGDHVFWVKNFIILFFIFLDILPITMKAATPYGDYEAERDKMLFAKIEKIKIEKEMISTFGKTADLNDAKLNVQHKQKMNELNEITRSANEFIKSQEKQRNFYDEDFSKQLNNLNKIKNTDLKNDRAHLVNEDRKIFKRASEISQRKFLEYLKSL